MRFIRNIPPPPRVVVIAIAITAVIAVTYSYQQGQISVRWKAAEKVLPAAQVFLKSDPQYEGVSVYATTAGGGALSFIGDLSSTLDQNRLEAHIRERFSSSEYALLFALDVRE